MAFVQRVCTVGSARQLRLLLYTTTQVHLTLYIYVIYIYIYKARIGRNSILAETPISKETMIRRYLARLEFTTVKLLLSITALQIPCFALEKLSVHSISHHNCLLQQMNRQIQVPTSLIGNIVITKLCDTLFIMILLLIASHVVLLHSQGGSAVNSQGEPINSFKKNTCILIKVPQ